MNDELTYKINVFYYTQIENSIPTNSMKILISPDEQRRSHLIVVGDSSGRITYYEIKDKSIHEVMGSEGSGKSPARFEKLSKMGRLSDKFMTAFGAKVAAYNAQGKEYFAFDTNLAESLKFALAEDSKFVFVCGEFILNFFEISNDTIEDVYQYICPSEILDIYVDSYDGVGYYVLLSCVDKRLRMLNNKGLVYEVKMDSNVYCFYPFIEGAYDFVNRKEQGKRYMLMGMSNGEVRCYLVNQFETKLEWTIKPHNGESKSEPQFIRLFRLSGRPKSEVVVVRADMTVDVYAAADHGNYEKVGTMKMESSITGIEGCFFSGYPIMIVTTFSGKIIGLSLSSEYKITAEDKLVEKPSKVGQSRLAIDL